MPLVATPSPASLQPLSLRGPLDPLSAALPIDREFCHPRACHEFFIKSLWTLGNAQLEAPSIMYHVEASAGLSQAPDVTVFQSALAGDRRPALSAPSGAQLWILNKYSCYERGHHTLGCLGQLLGAPARHRKTSLVWGVLSVTRMPRGPRASLLVPYSTYNARQL